VTVTGQEKVFQQNPGILPSQMQVDIVLLQQLIRMGFMNSAVCMQTLTQ